MFLSHLPPQSIQPSSHHTTLSFTQRSSPKPPSCSVAFTNPSTPSVAGAKLSSNQLIQSLCREGKFKQALRVLSHEPNPNQQTYEAMILCCGRNHHHRSSISVALRLHRHIIDNGSDQDPFLATKLIGMYSDLGSVDNARKVFDETRKRTIYVWNALFRALTLSGHGEEVLGLYQNMNSKRIGLDSDRFTYTYVLKACCCVVVASTKNSNHYLMKGREIHAHLTRRGYNSHVYIMTTLVDMYARFGFVDCASNVFDQMPFKNIVSWSAMIACYAKNGKAFEALSTFREMMRETKDLSPNSVTMVSVLQACASLAALEQGRLIHGYILRRGLDSILPVTSALVTMYGRCGKLELGQKVFDRMRDRDVVSWNSLISSYGVHGYGTKAIQIFEEMLENGASPTPVTFVSVLGACSHEGLVEEGKRLFESMWRDHGIKPQVEHYACMVDLLGRANKLDAAAKIVQEMRTEPGPKVWGSLLGSCRIHGNVELAERASRRLFALEPKNAGNYVLLADIYAEAKMWDKVKKIKKLLEQRGLQKLPGRCYMEVKKRMYTFVSVDENHAFVAKLAEDMKEKGYVPQTKGVLYELETEEKERIVLGHSEKLALAFGLINTAKGEPIRITKNLRLCEDCHLFTKFVSKFMEKEILVRDVNRFHRFKNGVCSCGDYW
ncbi:unnamed protein product [Cochlearia groenlandica]